MFENNPANIIKPIIDSQEQAKREEEKRNGFPSQKLGDMEDKVRELFCGSLSQSEAYSLLVTLFARNLELKKPTLVFKEYAENRLLEPSNVNPRDTLLLNSLLVSTLDPSVELVDTSPIVPSGAVSAVNKIDPKTILQTIKGAELISDTSIALALEAALRRSKTDLKRNRGILSLASTQRELRLQQFANPDFSPHYGSFTLVSASRDVGRFDFEKEAMFKHLDFFIRSLEALKEKDDYDIDDITVEISDISIVEKLVEVGLLKRELVTASLRSKYGPIDIFESAGVALPKRAETLSDFILSEGLSFLNVPIQVLKKFEKEYLSKLKVSYPDVTFVLRLDRSAGIGYFDSLCYKIRAKNSKGEIVPLVDGGASDWTAKFLSDSSERFFGSGLGSDVLIKKFNKKYE